MRESSGITDYGVDDNVYQFLPETFYLVFKQGAES